VTYLRVVNVPPVPANPMWEGVLVEVEVAAGAVKVHAAADAALLAADNQCGVALEPGKYPPAGGTGGYGHFRSIFGPAGFGKANGGVL